MSSKILKVTDFKNECDELGLDTKWYSFLKADDMKKKPYQKLYKILTKDIEDSDDEISCYGI